MVLGPGVWSGAATAPQEQAVGKSCMYTYGRTPQTPRSQQFVLRVPAHPLLLLDHPPSCIVPPLPAMPSLAHLPRVEG